MSQDVSKKTLSRTLDSLVLRNIIVTWKPLSASLPLKKIIKKDIQHGKVFVILFIFIFFLYDRARGVLLSN